MNEHITQLKALGYDSSDTVHIRAIADNGAQNLSVQVSKLRRDMLTRKESQGYGIYFVVNPGGRKDSDIENCRVIFYEHDNISKEQSKDLWKALNLPEPTIQVDTGGKSIHTYWALESPLPKSEWKVIQSDLLSYAKADTTLKNPSRVMRLVNFKHQKTGNLASIISNSGKRYSYEQLRAIIPTKKQESQKPSWAEFDKAFSIPWRDIVPLECALSRASRQLIKDGSSDYRNDNGAKLARDLIGTHEYLISEGQRVEGDPYQLFLEYCQRCPQHEGWNDSEWDSIWNSAIKSNPTPSLSPNMIEGCIKAWAWKNLTNEPMPLSEDKASKKVDKIHSKIEQLLDDILSGKTELERAQMELSALAKSEGVDSYWACQLLSNKYRQNAEFSTEETDVDGLQEIANHEGAGLDLRQVLYPEMASAFIKAANSIPVAPESVFVPFLPICASLIGTKSVVQIRKGWTEPSILWTSIVGPPGDGKTPAMKITRNPLKPFQARAYEKYQQDKQQYEAAIKESKKKKKDGDEVVIPEPASIRHYYTDDFTTEFITSAMAEDASKGQLAIVADELSSLFKSFGQYKGGSGNDRQTYLKLFNGMDIKVDRKGAEPLYRDSSAVSITGGIQDDVLAKLMAETDQDSDGMWGRFLFACPNRRSARERGPECDISGMLSVIYQNLDSMEERTYRLSSDAQKVFFEYELILDDRMPNFGRAYQNVLAKMKGYCSRLALVLHCIDIASGNIKPTDIIPSDTLYRSVYLCEYFLGQARLLNGKNDTWNTDNSLYLKILSHCRRNGGSITSSQAAANRYCKGDKRTSNDATELFEEMAAKGLGRVERLKRSGTRFIPLEGSLADLHSFALLPNLETLTGIGFQGFVWQNQQKSAFSSEKTNGITVIQNEPLNEGKTENEQKSTNLPNETLEPLPCKDNFVCTSAKRTQTSANMPNETEGDGFSLVTVDSQLDNQLSHGDIESEWEEF